MCLYRKVISSLFCLFLLSGISTTCKHIAAAEKRDKEKEQESKELKATLTHLRPLKGFILGVGFTTVVGGILIARQLRKRENNQDDTLELTDQPLDQDNDDHDIDESSDKESSSKDSDSHTQQKKVPSKEGIANFFNRKTPLTPSLSPYENVIQEQENNIKRGLNGLLSRFDTTTVKGLAGLAIALNTKARGRHIDTNLPEYENTILNLQKIQREVDIWVSSHLKTFLEEEKGIKNEKKAIVKEGSRFCYDIIKQVYEDSKNYIEKIARDLTSALDMEGDAWLSYSAYILVHYKGYEKAFATIKEKFLGKLYTFTLSHKGKQHNVTFDPNEDIPANNVSELLRTKRRFKVFLRYVIEGIFSAAYYVMTKQMVLDQETIEFEPQSSIQYNLNDQKDESVFSNKYKSYYGLQKWLHKKSPKDDSDSNDDVAFENSDNNSLPKEPLPIELAYYQMISFKRLEYQNKKLVSIKIMDHKAIFRDVQTKQDIV